MAFNQENFIGPGDSPWIEMRTYRREERLRKGISLWIAGGLFLAALAVGWVFGQRMGGKQVHPYFDGSGNVPSARRRNSTVDADTGGESIDMIPVF